MKLPRRRLLCAAGAGIALPILLPPSLLQAQVYPSRPVRLIEGFGAGGTPDILARLFGQWLAEQLGQPFVVENKSGATGRIATETVVRAPPDGHTLLLVVPANVTDAIFRDNLTFDFSRDIVPVAGIYRVPYVMDVHPSIPATTIAQFIAYARNRPGKINMASAGTGSTTHVVGELFKMKTGVDMLHVPYRGTQVYPDLLGGQVQVFFGPLPSSIGYIKAGKLRALAVTTAGRSSELPDVPTVGESVPGFEASAWFGVGAPRSTPSAIVDRLNKEINAGMADPTIKAKLAEQGGELLPGSPADFRKFIGEEIEKWGKVIQAANIRPD
jgi:tripartite-type tricarboxylate transporter receptor subunit TctC